MAAELALQFTLLGAGSPFPYYVALSLLLGLLYLGAEAGCVLFIYSVLLSCVKRGKSTFSGAPPSY